MGKETFAMTEMEQTTQNLFGWWKEAPPDVSSLDLRFMPEAARNIPKFCLPLLKKITQIPELMDVFMAVPADATPLEFSRKVFEVMNVNLEVDPELATNLPAEGPVIIVSNHPFGGIDGLAFMAAILPLRPDFRLLINIALGIFPQLRSCGLPLDILSGTAASFAINTASLRMANAELNQGHALGFFPSGTVSHSQRGKGIADPEWLITAARIAKKHKTPVLPIFFHGRNSLLFNAMGMIHPTMRTLFLPREFYNRRNTTIKLSAGRLIEPATFDLLDSPASITAYLRMRSYALQHKTQEKSSSQETQRPMEPVAHSHNPEILAETFANLPEECLLLKEGDYTIYSIRGGASPLLLEELGTLRESTFRLVGEGSGKARDLDIYDQRYHHLLLWNSADKCLAGAYRLGKVQELVAEFGPDGLYTTSLFRMNETFFNRYGDALELGRAVIHPRYQREYAPLMLLWKGIGRFVLRHEEIRCLFGPVSLSLDYTPVSLRTVIEYLQTQCGSAELATMVRGRTLPDKLLRKAEDIPLPDKLKYNSIVALVRDIEGGKGIPILFKHYLKLGGKIGAFHLDTSFNTLDAFLLMDLVDSPPNMLERYMTPEGAATFLNRWR